MTLFLENITSLRVCLKINPCLHADRDVVLITFCRFEMESVMRWHNNSVCQRDLIPTSSVYYVYVNMIDYCLFERDECIRHLTYLQLRYVVPYEYHALSYTYARQQVLVTLICGNTRNNTGFDLPPLIYNCHRSNYSQQAI